MLILKTLLTLQHWRDRVTLTLNFSLLALADFVVDVLLIKLAIIRLLFCKLTRT